MQQPPNAPPPAERLRLHFMLADGAEVHFGKLFIMGGAVNTRPPGVGGMIAIAGTMIVPWDQTNHPHTLRIDLQTADRHAVRVPTPIGEQPFTIEAQFEVGRPPGIPRGTAFTVPFAAQFGLPGLPEGSYAFRFSVDEIDYDEATLQLFVMNPPGQT